MPEKICQNCQFWKPGKNSPQGQCRLGHPDAWGWPGTLGTDWCGEFSNGPRETHFDENQTAAATPTR
jgi:hypothetical protein